MSEHLEERFSELLITPDFHFDRAEKFLDIFAKVEQGGINRFVRLFWSPPDQAEDDDESSLLRFLQTFPDISGLETVMQQVQNDSAPMTAAELLGENLEELVLTTRQKDTSKSGKTNEEFLSDPIRLHKMNLGGLYELFETKIAEYDDEESAHHFHFNQRYQYATVEGDVS